jgi:hypothetical protein
VRFSQWWNDDGGGPAIDTADKPQLPDGKHTGEIVSAKVKGVKFRVSDKNPDGTCLEVKVVVAGYQPVEALIPCDWRGQIESVCRSASVPVPGRDDDWDERVLVGRAASIDVVHAIAKSGREYVRVEKWIRGPEPLPEAVRKRLARTQAAKAHAEFVKEGDPDDIPF